MTMSVPYEFLRLGVKLPEVPEEHLPEVVKELKTGGARAAVDQIYHIGLGLKRRYREAGMKADPEDARLGDELIAWARAYRIAHPFNDFVPRRSPKPESGDA